VIIFCESAKEKLCDFFVKFILQAEIMSPRASSSQDIDFVGDLISPMPARNFLDAYWGKHFVHVEGSRNKFSHLFSWDQLNTALEQYPFEPPRLRLNRDGRDIGVEQYISTENLGNREIVRRLKSSEMINELRHGATLILSSADDLSFPLKDLCKGLERVFKTRVIANLYAVFTSGHPYPLQWDSQDTFILQLSGRKKWVVFEATQPHPLREYNEAPPQPTGAPIWDGILEQGGLFHIPRGWWRTVSPGDEPSLHLKITVKGPTGLDFLTWCADGLKRSSLVMSNAPLFECPESRRRYAETLKDEFISSLTAAAVERFLESRESSQAPRPEFSLPDAAITTSTSIRNNDLLKLASPRPLVLASEVVGSSTLTFEYGGKAWQCPAFLHPTLSLLNDMQSHRLSELLTSAPHPEQMTGIRQFVHELVKVGILTKAEAPEHSDESEDSHL
jgi:ribosomal protein L16 Arg81 hydroxylase